MLTLIASSFLDWLTPENLIEKGGPALLFLIIFAESGLLIGFFLPGDSLLFTAGAVAAGAFESTVDAHLNIWVIAIGCFIAAFLGDQVGYLIGRKAGPVLFHRPDSKLFKQEYVAKGHEFFEKYGAKAIILARFVPVVRTFVPTIAGVSEMDYGHFMRLNAAGAGIWAIGVTMLGYVFGSQDFVKDNFEVAILGVVAISFLPIIVEVIKHRRSKANAAS